MGVGKAGQWEERPVIPGSLGWWGREQTLQVKQSFKVSCSFQLFLEAHSFPDWVCALTSGGFKLQKTQLKNALNSKDICLLWCKSGSPKVRLLVNSVAQQCNQGLGSFLPSLFFFPSFLLLLTLLKYTLHALECTDFKRKIWCILTNVYTR